jgi:SET domain
MTNKVQQNILPLQSVHALEKAMRAMPDLYYMPPTKIYFHGGMICREVFRKAGVTIVGRIHKKEHFYVVASGSVLVTTDNGVRRIVGPEIVLSDPGTKRAVYAETDAVCITFHRTDALNLKDAAKELIEDDPNALFDDENKLIEDRADYQRILQETGFTHEQRRAISENESDQIPMPGDFNVAVLQSMIEGKGLFATMGFKDGQFICPARVGAMRTPAGRFTNHSVKPNAKMVADVGGVNMFAIRDINQGDEITVNYRQAKAEGEKICHG